MSTIALPPGFDDPAAFSLVNVPFQRVNAAPFGGSEQAFDLMNDRWEASVTVAACANDEAAANEAFIGALRGMTNVVSLFHLVRPVPRGTMRGTPITNPAAKGADQILIGTSLPFVTLLAGDMIGIDGLLLMVREDCAANGVGAMTVKFTNRLRRAIGGSLPVIWDRPTAPFRLASQPAIQYVPGWATETTFDFVEAIL